MSANENTASVGEERLLALDRTEQPHRLLVEQLPLGAATLTPLGRILYANHYFGELLGVAAERTLGHPLSDYVSTTDHPVFEGLLREGESGNARGQITIRRADGTALAIQLGVSALKGPCGDCLMVLDLTDQRRQERLAATERARMDGLEHMNAIHAHAPIGIAEVDLQGQLLRVNEQFCRITGYSREELLARRFEDIVHPADVRSEIELERRLHNGSVPQYRAETRLVHRDGSTVWTELHTFLVRNVESRAAFSIRFIENITDRKQAEVALKDMDRHKDEFLATLAHELRNPLAPIRNAIEILRGADPHGSTAVRAREIIERQVQHLVRLVDDLLDIARISRGQIELRFGPLDLDDVIRDALEVSRPVIEAAGHHLSVRLPDESVMLHADPVRLTQIVSNLVNNAAKYTLDGGRIDVTAQCEAGEAVIRVRDDGIGIPEDVLPHVFDTFSQTHGSRAQGGFGIGLKLVKTLVQMHGGTVEARSGGHGQGSEFTVRLPLAPQEIVQTPSPEAAATPPQRILIVEDNSDAADSLVILLGSLGYEVQVANDGPFALQMIDAHRPDVVLLDVGLPGMDGYEVARSVRSRAELQGVKLIAVTGWGQAEDRRRSREAGFDHHMIKPVDFDALRSLLKTI